MNSHTKNMQLSYSKKKIIHIYIQACGQKKKLKNSKQKMYNTKKRNTLELKFK